VLDAGLIFDNYDGINIERTTNAKLLNWIVISSSFKKDVKLHLSREAKWFDVG